MNKYDALLEYFPSGTAEGERHILRAVFVAVDEYADLMTPPPFNPRLLVGKKGTGKSALLEFYLKLMVAGKVPCLLLKPKDIDLGTLPDRASVGQAPRLAYDALVRAVGEKLGAEKSGLITEDDKILYEQAIAGGHKKRDAVEKLANLLPRIAKPLTPIDFASLLPQIPPATRKQLENAITSTLEKSSTGFYLFLDDTDQIAALDQPGHLNRIWSLVLAARELAGKSEQIRVVVSLREEVWRRLARDNAGQRDQTDHFVSLVRTLAPTRQHIGQIVERRLELAASKLDGCSAGSVYQQFFTPNNPRMPSSDERSSWSDLIVQRSRERPRDAVQLVNALAVHARRAKATSITDDHFAVVMKAFSSQCVEQIGQEAEFECPAMRDVIRSLASLEFDRGSFKIAPETLRTHLHKLPTFFSLSLFGRTLRADDDENAIAIWKYLWELGILNARVRDNTQKDKYRHIFPHEDPGLVSRSRWNEMQTVTWEINPAFRDYLIGVQQDLEKKK